MTADPEARQSPQRDGATDQLEQLVVRSVYGEMIGRPVDDVYRALDERLRAADVEIADERLRAYAASISDGTFELLR
jgi:hypothetical protein